MTRHVTRTDKHVIPLLQAATCWAICWLLIAGDVRPVRLLNCGQVELACQGIFPILNELSETSKSMGVLETIGKVCHAYAIKVDAPCVA
jgi:hypothetical protein